MQHFDEVKSKKLKQKQEVTEMQKEAGGALAVGVMYLLLI